MIVESIRHLSHLRIFAPALLSVVLLSGNRLDAAVEDCLRIPTYYSGPTSDLEQIDLGEIEIHCAKLDPSDPIYLSVDQFDGAGDLMAFIPWSNDPPLPGGSPARFEFKPSLCGGLPRQVWITLRMCTGESTYYARDAFGALLMTAVTYHEGFHTVELKDPEGIASITVHGWEIYVSRICWSPNYYPDVTSMDGCEWAADHLSTPQEGLSEVTIGAVRITEAVHAGVHHHLAVEDGDADGDLEVTVRWSDALATDPAAIYLDGVGDELPLLVEVVLATDNAVLRAYDGDGAWVATAAAVTLYAEQQLFLFNPLGISRIEILGTQILLEGVCWSNEALPPYSRGDVNTDGGLDIGDAIAILSYLFAGGSQPSCLDAADANDSGTVDIADAIAILDYLFRGTGSLPAPFGACGEDPTDDALDCVRYPPCEE